MPPSPSAAASLRAVFLAFFSMLDRRKRLHREISEQLPVQRSDVAATAIPAMSLIEQMSVQRAPVTAFAPRTQAARAYRTLWAELTSAEPGPAEVRAIRAPATASSEGLGRLA